VGEELILGETSINYPNQQQIRKVIQYIKRQQRMQNDNDSRNERTSKKLKYT